jgi:hypothetical protein
MYSELLSDLCLSADPDEVPSSTEELVADLRQCRLRLHQRAALHKHMVAEDLARQLDHDRVLLSLCAAMSIEHDPARFVNPISERRRLEEVLRQRGIEFEPLDDQAN